MKKILFIFLFLLIVLTSSCKNEKTIYKIYDLDKYKWINENIDFDKVRCENGEFFTMAESRAYVTYTNDKDEIKSIIEILKKDLKKEKKEPIYDGGYIKFTFYKDDNSYNLKIDNGRIDLDDEYFLTFDEIPFVNSNDKYEVFMRNIYYVYDLNNILIYKSDNLDTYELKRIDKSDVINSDNPKYKIRIANDNEEIYIYDKKTISVKNIYYEVVNKEFNLSF